MNILETIIAHKRKEVALRRKEQPFSSLEKGRFFASPVRSMTDSLQDENSTGIIAEFKRKSPSKGIINNRDSVETVTRFYSAYGAAGLSILTDYNFFGGSLDDLVAARDNDVPILRKDFMVDPYQVVEAKAYGADVILLIAACLTAEEVKSLATEAKKLGLQVLLELHTEDELDHINDLVDMVGVNNRNLKNFEVDIEHSVRMANKIGNNCIKIAESGINDVKTIHYLKANGFTGFLIGEYFMKQQDPGLAFKNFTYQL